MTKMRKTFLNIACKINEKRQFQKNISTKKERRSRMLKISITVLLTALIISGGIYVSKGLLAKKRAALPLHAPKWTELDTASREYSQATQLVDDMIILMRQQGTDGLKEIWSAHSSPENISHSEKTLSLYKGEELIIQSVREKADASKKFALICKSPNNGHRLKISFCKENDIVKLSGADMIP